MFFTLSTKANIQCVSPRYYVETVCGCSVCYSVCLCLWRQYIFPSDIILYKKKFLNMDCMSIVVGFHLFTGRFAILRSRLRLWCVWGILPSNVNTIEKRTIQKKKHYTECVCSYMVGCGRMGGAVATDTQSHWQHLFFYNAT